VKNSFPSRPSHLWLVWSTLQAGRGLAVQVALLPQRWRWMVQTSAYAKIGKFLAKSFLMTTPLGGRSENNH
jgi:hypothetical protein